MQTNTPNTVDEFSLPQTKILIVGTGAVGSFYGGKLAQAGARVSAVCRSDYDAVKTRGINITSTWGDFHFMPETVIRDVRDYDEVPDYILVALKVLPQIDTPAVIGPAVGRKTSIVLLQNGVEIEPRIAEAFPHNEIISGLAFICVSRLGPGEIAHQDYGRLVIGLYPEGTSDKAQWLGRLFNAAGVPCDVTRNVVTARWQKLIWNAPFNPISVLGGGADTRTMLECSQSAELARKVMEEVALVAEATGHKLPESLIDKNLEDTWAMKPYKTSMLLDFEAGRPMEVEAILGHAIRAADREGVPVPHLESLYGLLTLADQQNRARKER